MKQIKLTFVFAFLMLSFASFAQNSSISIQGILTDANGVPLIGSQTINVVVRDGTNPDFSTSATITANDNGFYATVINNIPTILFKENTEVVVDGIVSEWNPTPYADRAKSLEGNIFPSQIDATGSSQGDVLQIDASGNPVFGTLSFDSPILVMNQQNFTDFQTSSSNEFIKIDGQITLTTNLEIETLQSHIVGGTISSSQLTTRLDLGTDNVYENTIFSGITIESQRNTFINCSFLGVNLSASSNTYLGGTINDSQTEPFTIGLSGEFFGVEINNSTIEKGYFTSVEINNSSLYEPFQVHSSQIRNTAIRVTSGKTSISNNHFRESIIRVTRDAIINNNTFKNIYPSAGTDYFIRIETSSGVAQNVSLSTNSFVSGSLSPAPKGISIIGGSNQNNIIVIQGNGFTYATNAFVNTSSSKMAIQNNVVVNGNIGNLGTSTSQGNIDLD